MQVVRRVGRHHLEASIAVQAALADRDNILSPSIPVEARVIVGDKVICPVQRVVGSNHLLNGKSLLGAFAPASSVPRGRPRGCSRATDMGTAGKALDV